MDSKDIPLSLYGWRPSWIWPKKRVKGVEKFETLWFSCYLIPNDAISTPNSIWTNKSRQITSQPLLICWLRYICTRYQWQLLSRAVITLTQFSSLSPLWPQILIVVIGIEMSTTKDCRAKTNPAVRQSRTQPSASWRCVVPRLVWCSPPKCTLCLMKQTSQVMSAHSDQDKTAAILLTTFAHAFLVWKLLYFDSSCTEMCSHAPN